jgi:hypothetical protein
LRDLKLLTCQSLRGLIPLPTLRVIYAVESAMARHSDNIESCTRLAHAQSKTTPYNTHTSLERTNNRNVDHRGQILDACRRALPLVGRCAAGPKVEPARHKHGQDRRPQEAAQGRGVVEGGAALKDVLPQQNQLARRIRIFWDPLECGGLSVAEGTLIVFLRHPPITVKSPGQ